MRKLFIAFLFVAISYTAAFAVNPPVQPIERQAVRAEDDLNILTGTKIQLEQEGQEIARVKINLIREDSDIKNLQRERDRKIRAQQMEDPSLHAELASVSLRVQNYRRECMTNGGRKVWTYYPPSPPPAEALACDREYDSLSAAKANVERKLANHQETDLWIMGANGDLMMRKSALSRETLDNFNKEKANRNAVIENDAAIVAAKVKLDKIRAKNETCREAIKSGNKRRMKAVCGEMFDGNTDKPATTLIPSRGVVGSSNK